MIAIQIVDQADYKYQQLLHATTLAVLLPADASRYVLREQIALELYGSPLRNSASSAHHGSFSHRLAAQTWLSSPTVGSVALGFRRVTTRRQPGGDEGPAASASAVSGAGM